ncbi:hypothetical protein LPJ78_002523 [Coemansia sp. RSA 989]|nr:hypothetical protein BX667DRAFT_499960 [Coemansia mojavensis]KAJ1742509.1 hypothetical protein LPJ68_001865 [Coemansia sp. RSA 1086]KAJ1749798.1 hypothetical protein LPJ79_003425 [Coemansia sp. RSA 1821]KAJ1865669.1 hypothetical protein LPJ78_002523 [Coemansia sp. RSA 989]KAJ2669673.1 hypothetical protein IWW42_004441 [Coemansia sp. RSA 1085]
MQGKRRNRDLASTRRMNKKPIAQFPALSSDAPPAYSEAGSSRQPESVSAAEYYHPASFPGYVAVQVVNGETQALLRRPDRQGRRVRGRIVRRNRGCLGWLCGRLCSLLCFVTGILIVSAFVGSILYVARHVLPPTWDHQCFGLSVQANQTYTYAQPSRLSIESIEGMSMTNVYVRPSQQGDFAVQVVVEAAGSSEQWKDRILVESLNHPDARLSLRVLKPRWTWPQECIRASIYVLVPSHADTRLDHLYIRANTGMLRSLDAGSLAVNTIEADLHNSLVQLRNLTVHHSLDISTKNSRINATDIRAPGGDIAMQSSNGGVTLTRVYAQGIEARTSNAGVRAASLRASRVSLHTTNAPVWLRQIEALELNAVTTNAAIRGDLAVGSKANVRVQTTNAPVSLQITGRAVDPAGENKALIRAYSTNNAVEVDAVGLRGSFDVTTTNSRAQVTGADGLLKYRRFTDSLKSGTYGVEPNSYIALSTSNARASLNFH